MKSTVPAGSLAGCLRVVDVEASAVLHGGGGRVHLGAVRLEAEHEGHLGGADAAGRGARGLAEQAAAEPVRGAGVGARAGAALPSLTLLSCQSTEGCADLLDDDVVLGAAGARGHGGRAGVLQRQQEAGGGHGRVGDGAVALLRADAVAVVLVGEVVAARVVVGVDVARGPREPLQAVLGRPPLRRAAAHAHYRSLSLYCVWAPDLRHPDGEGG